MKLLLKSCSTKYVTVIVSLASMEVDYCDECGVPVSHVCMHMCMSVSMLISGTTRSNFT